MRSLPRFLSNQRNYEDNQEDQDEVALLDETVNLQSNEIIDTFLVTFHGFRFEEEQIWERGDQRQKPSGDDKSNGWRFGQMRRLLHLQTCTGSCPLRVVW